MRIATVRFLITAALLFGVLGNAYAIPMLRLTTSAGGDVTVKDGDVTDQMAANGVVLFNGSLAGWAINITTGLSKPAVGSATAPLLDLNSVNLSSSSTGSIDIWLTDTDFTALPSATAVLAAIGGTTSGTVSYQTFFDSSNTPFGTASLLTSSGPLAPPAFSSNKYGTLSSTDPFSLTLLVSITHDAAYELSSFDATVKVPEPDTVLLLAIGSLALVLAARRRILTSASATY